MKTIRKLLFIILIDYSPFLKAQSSEMSERYLLYLQTLFDGIGVDFVFPGHGLHETLAHFGIVGADDIGGFFHPRGPSHRPVFGVIQNSRVIFRHEYYHLLQYLRLHPTMQIPYRLRTALQTYELELEVYRYIMRRAHLHTAAEIAQQRFSIRQYYHAAIANLENPGHYDASLIPRNRPPHPPRSTTTVASNLFRGAGSLGSMVSRATPIFLQILLANDQVQALIGGAVDVWRQHQQQLYGGLGSPAYHGVGVIVVATAPLPNVSWRANLPSGSDVLGGTPSIHVSLVGIEATFPLGEGRPMQNVAAFDNLLSTASSTLSSATNANPAYNATQSIGVIISPNTSIGSAVAVPIGAVFHSMFGAAHAWWRR